MTGDDVVLWGLAALAGAACAWWVMRAYAGAAGGHARTALAVSAGVLAAASVAYLALGRPDLPAQPHAARIAALETQAGAEDFFNLSPEAQLALMAARARATPKDPRPWMVTGLIQASLGDDEAAARAFENALRRDPVNPGAMIELGRVLTRLQQGAASPQTVQLFQAAAALDADNPVPWLYLALAASQEARWADAVTLWPKVQTHLPKDDPRQAMAAQMRAEAEKALKEAG